MKGGVNMDDVNKAIMEIVCCDIEDAVKKLTDNGWCYDVTYEQDDLISDFGVIRLSYTIHGTDLELHGSTSYDARNFERNYKKWVGIYSRLLLRHCFELFVNLDEIVKYR